MRVIETAHPAEKTRGAPASCYRTLPAADFHGALYSDLHLHTITYFHFGFAFLSNPHEKGNREKSGRRAHRIHII